MNPSQIYIALTIVVLFVIFILVFFVNKSKKAKKLTPLAALAFGFVMAGIISTSIIDSRLISYGLYAAAVIISIIDILKRRKIK
jgi:asparagine N-glycosylation enzyme membrane subunit Stt3